MRSILLASVLVLPAIAAAQDALPIEDTLHIPGFVTLDRFDANSRIGAEMSYLNFDGDEDATGLRFDVHGHYVDQASGLGGYVTLPITFFSANDDSNTALGNIELGGLWMKQVAPKVGLVVRGGLGLPTSSEEDGLQNIILGYSRFADLATTLPKATTLRLAVSPVFRSGNLFGRVDLGLDVVLDSSDDTDIDTLLRFQPGIGVIAGNVAIMGELAVLHANDETNTNAAVSARFLTGSVEPYVGLVIPFDDEVQDIMNLAVTIGVDAKI